MWLSTTHENVYIIDSEKNPFETYSKSENSIYGLHAKDITMIVELPNKKIALGGESGGLSFFDADTGKFKHFMFQKNGKLYPLNANAIYDLPGGDYLISTRDGTSTFRFDINEPILNLTRTRQFDFLENFYVRNILYENAESRKPRTHILAQDKSDNKLVLLNFGTNNELRVQRKLNITLEQVTSKITLIHGNNYLLSDNQGRVRLVSLNSNNEYVDRVIWRNSVGLNQSVVTDKKGYIYIVSYETGIYRSKTATGMLTFDFEKILDYHGLYELIFDETEEYGWVSSKNGLIRYELSTGKIDKFHKSDGLQGNEFHVESTKASDGSIYFGGINGFTRFFPEDIQKNQERFDVIVTDFSLSNKKVQPIPSANNGLIQSISSTDYLRLNHQQNNFGFKFSTIVLPEKQRRLEYAYQLEGYDLTWNQVDYTQRYANYTNIPSGDYTFRVKVKNQNGLWSEKDRTIDITVLPPWWKTIWAYSIYILLFVLSMYLVISFACKP
jgi:hypothetical protein